MTQQPATFVGIMARTYSFLADTGRVDLWVMDAKVQYVDDAKPVQDTKLYAVRGVEGVEAVPLYKGNIRARLDDGTFQNCVLVGLDDASLIGGPADMVAGSLADLRRSGQHHRRCRRRGDETGAAQSRTAACARSASAMWSSSTTTGRRSSGCRGSPPPSSRSR
ncbi:MAG: hypothetical protein U1E43_00095 [Rhodospirillales bacterium]